MTKDELRALLLTVHHASMVHGIRLGQGRDDASGTTAAAQAIVDAERAIEAHIAALSQQFADNAALMSRPPREPVTIETSYRVHGR